MIQTQLAMGIKPAAIALGLNRSASTLSRELRRNGWFRPMARRGPGRAPVAGGYRAEVAHRRAHTCVVTLRVERRLRAGSVLWNRIMRYLKAGYSPEQIAGTLRLCIPKHLRCGFRMKPSTPRSTPCRVASCARR